MIRFKSRALVIASLVLLLVAAVVLAYVFSSGEEEVVHDRSVSPQEKETDASIGWVDTPSAEMLYNPQVVLSGWALDKQGVERVEVVLDGEKRFKAQYGIARPDVAHAHAGFPDAATGAGFRFRKDLTEYATGRHTLEVVVVDKAGEATVIARKQLLMLKENTIWRPLLEERKLHDDTFHVLFATSIVTEPLSEGKKKHRANARKAAAEIATLYNSLNSTTMQAGVRIPILYLRTTKGEDEDWVFDPNYDINAVYCGQMRRLTEDSLQGVMDFATEYNIPVLFTLNGGVWADAACHEPGWDINDHLEEDIDNCQWSAQDEVVSDDYLKSLPGSTTSPELARMLTLNVYAEEVRHYKKRNLQDAARHLARFAEEHPHLFAGVNLDPDVYINPFFESRQWFDYNPDTLRQFRDWLQAKGPYSGEGGEGMPDLSAYARKKPLTLAEVNALSGKAFDSWDDVEPPREFPGGRDGFWIDNPWMDLWKRFRRHLVDLHYDELSEWVAEEEVAERYIFSAQGFQAPFESHMPFPLRINSPMKNYDDGGVSIEGSVPTRGHLGVIIYGDSALNNIRMEEKDSLFEEFRRVDSEWGIVEYNTATYLKPAHLPGYAGGHASLRDLFNYGARFVSPMAWNGSNGIFVGQEGFASYTSVRNTPLEEAIRDFMHARAYLPRNALIWTFGSPRFATDDGWTLEGKGRLAEERDQLRVYTEEDPVTLVSPHRFSFIPAEHDLLIIKTEKVLRGAVEVFAVAGAGPISLSGKQDIADLHGDMSGVHIPISWDGIDQERVSRVYITFYPEEGGVDFALDHIVFYPKK